MKGIRMTKDLSKNVVYTVSHLIDGKLKKALVVSSITKALAVVSSATDTNVDNPRTRSALALSFSPNNTPFTMVQMMKDNRKHVFRIDKQELEIGVKIK